jgi:hypothetical protein
MFGSASRFAGSKFVSFMGVRAAAYYCAGVIFARRVKDCTREATCFWFYLPAAFDNQPFWGANTFFLEQERGDIPLERRDTTQEPHPIRLCIHSAAF